MPFAKLGLNEKIVANLAACGYNEPTPIQSQAIPEILEGHDILAAAQTGTGKTAAFTLPIIHMLSQIKPGKPVPVRALVLTPTRELANQVEDSVKKYAKQSPLKAVAVYGGISIYPQIKWLKHGKDIVIATPGRLLDLVRQNAIDLSMVQTLVLDEADRMLDMGFIHDIRKIIAELPAQRQTLLFSATYSGEVKKLAKTITQQPKIIQISQQNAPIDLVTQIVVPVDRARKRELLSYLIGSQDWKQVLVFARTKHGADRLSEQLRKDGLKSKAIHGDKSQGARATALKQFKANEIRVLVATDIAARGLDIQQLPHVINFNLPTKAEDYVHRIGRTGRAQCTGEAISLLSHDEAHLLKDVEQLIKMTITREEVEGFEPSEPIKDRPKPAKKKSARKRPPRKNRQGSGTAKPPRRAKKPKAQQRA